MHSNKPNQMEKTTIVNVIITVNNMTQDAQYKISVHPRDLRGINSGLTLEQELKNSEIVQAFIDRKSEEDLEDLEVVTFEVVLSSEKNKNSNSKLLEIEATASIKTKP